MMIVRAKWLVIVLAVSGLMAGPVAAQKTKAVLNTEIGVQFPDNMVNGVAPANLRAVTSDIVNAIMPTAPVVNGNLACFNGTTGLLKDCAIAPSGVGIAIGSTAVSGGSNLNVLAVSGGLLAQYGVSGSGNVALTTSPVFTTPNLGVATATSFNGTVLTRGVSSTSSYGIGDATTAPAMNAASDNIAIGTGAGQALTTGIQNILIGTSNGNALTIDNGNTLVGYDIAPLLHNGIIPNNFNTGLGNQVLRSCTGCGSNVALGRASMLAATTDDHNTAVGHATLFTGVGNSQTTAIGDSAGGSALAGTAIPSGFPNTGVNVFPFNGDTNLECIGETCGKATSAARKQSLCIGSYCRIPARDNSAWIGNGLQSTGTAGRLYDGTSSVTLNSNTGQTWTCAQLLAGILNRTGAIGGAFNEQPPTAQAIVQCTTGGVGNSSEVPVSVPFHFINNGTGGTATIVTNTGLTLSGLSQTIANSTSAIYRIIVTNSTAGAEAVTVYRVQ